MAKDTYYFSHDSNARNDIKVVRLRRALGMEGYGIYFALIEVLREQEGFKLPLEALSDIAFDLHTSDEKVKAVVMAYDLFIIEDNVFFSARLHRSMDEFNTKRQKFVEAGRKGGEASVKHRLSIGQPLKERKVKESKGKEKEKKEFIPPSVSEVEQYFKEKGYTLKSARKAHEFYETGNWHDSKGNRVLSWKQKMQSVWFKDENLEYKQPEIFEPAEEMILNKRKPIQGK